MSLTKRIPEVLGLVAALVLAGGCETLNVKNPNAPDSARLLTDPATVQSIAVGAMRTWYSTTQGPTDGADPYPGLTLSVMAKSHVAAWNNYNIRFYTGCTDAAFPGYPTGSCNGSSEGSPYPRIEWQNDAASAQRTQIEYLWYGYYSALSSANDVVTAIRKKNLVITDAATTKMVETMGVLTLAYFPRTAAENVNPSVVNWATVVSYAKNGISSTTAGTAFDWVFHQDGCINWCDFFKVWSNDMTTMRIHSRVAHLMDPNLPDPWAVAGSSSPHSPDNRLGDGTMRADRASPEFASAMSVNPDLTGNGGYDYVWSFDQEIQRKTRGLWHQSAVGQVRYDSLASCGDNPEGLPTGVGDGPVILAAENDLIWAEALIRAPTQDLATAATLINNTRVGPDRMGRPRGGLTAASAADGTAGLLAELQYEQDVELPGSNGFAPFFNQRRIDNLEPLTPHEMPVPAKELGVLPPM